MRLQKYLAMNGVASRRQCESFIAAGLIEVNGQVVTEMGVQINPENDEVTYRGKPVRQQEQKITILLHKPMGVISTASDQFDRPTVVDLVNRKERLYPVGRLDYLTSGLILLTNDGDLALRLTHPRYETEKVYQAELHGIITEEKMQQFREGIQVEDYVTLPAQIRIIHKEKDRCQVEIVLREGRNRQVRKMCETLGYPVSHLKRVAIGSLTLGDLQPGQCRLLTEEEVKELMQPKGRKVSSRHLPSKKERE
ncbi:MAG: pseudouridine synthase [Bacillota bacterium]|nr:pseudouridine synthase [Bacillota bacterium]MDW7676035.1 pseudouridine synthase [Bacillota bacterium]